MGAAPWSRAQQLAEGNDSGWFVVAPEAIWPLMTRLAPGSLRAVSEAPNVKKVGQFWCSGALSIQRLEVSQCRVILKKTPSSREVFFGEIRVR